MQTKIIVNHHQSDAKNVQTNLISQVWNLSHVLCVMHTFVRAIENIIKISSFSQNNQMHNVLRIR